MSGYMVYRFVEVKEFADHGTVADVFGYSAEAVILGNTADVILAVILSQGLRISPVLGSITIIIPP